LRDAAQTIFDDAKINLKDAKNAYEDAVTSEGAKDILKARAETNIAEERYYTALDYARILQTGADAQTVTASQRVLDQAKAAVAQAQNSVKQAQANLDLLDAQVGKLVVTAPVDGVVLTRAGEPGSVVNAGGTVLTLGRLDDLTITVYVPEDRMAKWHSDRTPQSQSIRSPAKPSTPLSPISLIRPSSPRATSRPSKAARTPSSPSNSN